MRNQRGITLIALVITIIVLLILAGVSIAMLTGDNGILTKATQSSEDTQKAEISEKVNMAIQAAYADAVLENTADPDLTVDDIATQYKADNPSATATASGTTLSITEDSKTYSVTVEAKNNSYVTSADNVTIQ